MGPIGRLKARPRWLLFSSAAGSGSASLLVAVVLLAALVVADGQTIAFIPGSPSLVIAYDWKITKTVGGAASNAGGVPLTVVRGSPLQILYTIRIERFRETGAAAPMGKLSFTVTCPTGPGNPTSVTVSDVGGGPISTAPATGPTTTFTNVAYPAPASPTNTPQGQIRATCVYSGTAAPIDGPPVDVIYSTGNTQEIRATATLTDVITWPNWSTYYVGTWLNVPPSTTLTSGMAPNTGTTVAGPFPVVYEYTYTVGNTLLCFTGAQVSNVATLTAGAAGTEQRTYKAEAAAILTVTGCDVVPAITIDQPNLQTSLTYAWTQSITPVTPAAITVPWGGGGTVTAQARFTRVVTAAVFQASFTVTLTNPAAAPIAVTNLQLACPWGSNTMLPCGSMAGLTAGGTNMAAYSTNNVLVIPASASINCMVNNLQIAATWGNDFTQPCQIITSNWLGTQVVPTQVVLDFSAPQRWQTINNCALWSVTCSTPMGNAFYTPILGGMPTAQQVCGSDTTNAPLPPQQFDIAFSGGWIGDGTQAAACVSGVTTTCTSQLQLQSTQGTTQSYGGTQTNTLTLQAAPTNCPLPPPPPAPVAPAPVVLPPPPPPTLGLMANVPVVTASVTKTYIRGDFLWRVSSQLSPADIAIAQTGAGVLSRYTVVAAPESVAGAAAPQYQLEGFVSVVNSNPNPVRVDEVYVVVDTAAVPLGCKPGLPGILSPGARVDCGFLVNYNMGGAPNTLYGRAVVVSDLGGRTNAEGTQVAFSFDSADVSGAKGACARVSQTFATNWFDLVQVSGVAPSFDSDDPTTVCSPATWRFDVRITPRANAPCAVQQVVQTVDAQYFRDSQNSAQASSTANLFVTGGSCPPAPAGYATGLSTDSADTTNSTSSGSGSSAGVNESGELTAPPPGLSVAVSETKTAPAAAPVWDVAIAPADNETVITAGKPGAVGFKLTWSKLQQATDYSGTVTVVNNSPQPAELDGVYIALVDTMADGDATDEGMAECPVGPSGTMAPVTGSNPYTVPANGRLTCKFNLRSIHSGALVGTATGSDGGNVIVSKQYPVQKLMSDTACGKLVYGLAASELGATGVLKTDKGVQEDEVCSAGSKTVQVAVPADVQTFKGCTIPVVTMAWMKPYDVSSTGTVAYAKSDVKIDGCTIPQATAATASIAGLTLTKGRMLRWAVSMKTDPPVLNETFEGKSVAVSTVWQQKSEPAVNASGEVVVKGSGAATKAKVLAIPLCGPGSGPDCQSVTLEANCKTANDSKDMSRCIFNFTKLPYIPGFFLPSVDGVQPAAAQPYDLARARFGGRPAPECAVLSEERKVDALDEGIKPPNAVATGAAALPTEPFCGMQFVRNYTLTFEGMDCENTYAFNATVTATPVSTGAKPVSGGLAFDVICPED